MLFIDVTGLDWDSEDQGDRGNAAEPGKPVPGEVASTVITAWRTFAGDDTSPERSTGGELPGEPGRWQVVRAIDLLDDEVDLAPARRVESAGFGKTPMQTLDEARTLRCRLRGALDTVSDALPSARWPVGQTPPSRPTGSLAEPSFTGGSSGDLE